MITNRRLFLFKGLLWTLTGLGAAVATVRFIVGLGATTALSDTTPWGLWIGFDVMGGVALAAGGFVTAAIVHIFHRERYHEAARPAILTAFLGYAAVVVGLIFDLGLPWNIWHPVVFWNPRSPLFEVAWCVMLYLTVLALEVSPVLVERTRFKRLHANLRRLQLPVMILGIMLSTLHQSSLGSMLLIMPFRVHPLWYSSMLPELFFVSAIALGLCMVMFESALTSWLYRRAPETRMLSGLARLATWALAFYLVFRVGDLAFQHKLGLLAEPGWPRALFAVEMLLSTVLPLVLFAIPRVRRSLVGIWIGAACAVSGFVLNRIDAAGLSQVATTGRFYAPSWMEISVSLSVVSAFALVFFLIQERFPVNPQQLDAIERDRERASRTAPQLAPFTQVWLGAGWRRPARTYSMLFALAAAFGFTVTPVHQPIDRQPAVRARGGDVVRVGWHEPYVYFDHARHAREAGGATACGTCHHLHTVGDIGTPCSDCHRLMYASSSIFDHGAHVAALGDNGSCRRCHESEGAAKLTSTKSCESCHRSDKAMMASGSQVKSFTTGTASSYMSAMHDACTPCHREKALDPSVGQPDLARCGGCHNQGTRTERAYRLAQAGQQQALR
jgi:Ni/Fe-hydrogenase subunit HybB-like protein